MGSGALWCGLVFGALEYGWIGRLKQNPETGQSTGCDCPMAPCRSVVLDACVRAFGVVRSREHKKVGPSVCFAMVCLRGPGQTLFQERRTFVPRRRQRERSVTQDASALTCKCIFGARTLSRAECPSGSSVVDADSQGA